jgi:hypothetical protein
MAEEQRHMDKNFIDLRRRDLGYLNRRFVSRQRVSLDPGRTLVPRQNACLAKTSHETKNQINPERGQITLQSNSNLSRKSHLYIIHHPHVVPGQTIRVPRLQGCDSTKTT